MKGKHTVVVQNKRIRYEFTIKRNLTVIRGDSATGKTTLIDMIREYYENGDTSAVELQCDRECAVLEGRTWSGQLAMMQDSIVFIDEGNSFVMSDEFSRAIQNTDNYYVIVTREGIPSLPYSVEEIYGIRNSGKYGTLKQTYHEFYHLYPKTEDVVSPQCVITEDSNAGFQFFHGVCKRSGKCLCISAQGKSNVFSTVLENMDGETLVIADGAAFGSEMDKLMYMMREYPGVKLYLPESFEWLLLRAGLVRDRRIAEELEHPEEQIESREYFSWERYFTAQLVRLTQNSYLQYNKKQLNPAYLNEKVANKILEVLEKIELTDQ